MPKIVELHRAESTRSIHLYKTFVCFFGTWKSKTNDFELVHTYANDSHFWESKAALLQKKMNGNKFKPKNNILYRNTTFPSQRTNTKITRNYA